METLVGDGATVMVKTMSKMDMPFIKTKDKNTKEQLEKQGFVCVASEPDGTFTFINDGAQRFQGSTKKMVFTDILGF